MSVGPLIAPAPAEVVAERLEVLRRRIVAAGAVPGSVTVVAVTKGFDARAPLIAATVGLHDVGENYADELLAKAGEIDNSAPAGTPDLRWHLIGAIQRRTVKTLAPIVACWQTVARPAEAESVAHHAPGAAVLVQVAVTPLQGRNGCPPDDVPALVHACRAVGLDVRGLMSVGPGGAPESAREVFDRVGALADELGLPERSMGMSDDLDAAVAAGSTMVRVGRALFGDRGGNPR